MKKARIKMKLLSDLCVSDGSSYTSVVNVDVCYDTYGFPYIPAKRIKGCLRECAIELSDWGWKNNEQIYLDEERINDLFGNEEHAGKICMGNAYLDKYEEQISKIATDNVLFHPQNVLSTFSYVRDQAKVVYATGGGEMLRSNRVVNKGLEFYAEVEYDPVYEEELTTCCKILTHMGMHRARGYGEVKAEIIDDLSDYVRESNKPEWLEGANKLSYTIYLEDAVICQSVAGNTKVTMDYIDGGKILGLIAGKLREEGISLSDFYTLGKEEETNEFICSNAYIGENNKRYTEAPGCYYSIKNESSEYINKLYPESKKEKDKNWQLNMMKHCYVYEENDKLKQKYVNVGESYHHRRPADKSIGHAIEGNFYQMESISKGQEFYGFILGSSKQIKKVYELLEGIQHIGYSKNTEYGKVYIQITGLEKEEKQAFDKSKELVVKLEAPVIVYNEKAFYSTDSKDLVAEIMTEFKIDESKLECVDKYLKYVRLGGYNVTWQHRKPTIDAFDKGTVLHFVFKEPVELPKADKVFLGERVTEGFGETTVYSINSMNEKAKELRICKFSDDEETKTGNKYEVQAGSLVEPICISLYRKYLEVKAIEKAQDYYNEIEQEYHSVYKSIVRKLMECQNYTSMSEFKSAIEGKYDGKSDKKIERKKQMEAFFKKIITEEFAQCITDFQDTYKLEWYPLQNEESYSLIYLSAYLDEMMKLGQGGMQDRE